MTSIRRRTSVLVAASVAGLLALGGLGLFVVVRAALTRQFDDGLAARAAALQSLTRADAGHVEMDIAGESMPRYQPGKDAELFAAWVRDGRDWRVLERSESLRAVVWPGTEHEPPALGMADRSLPDGRAGRTLTVEFVPLAERERAEEGEPPSVAGRKPDPTAATARPAPDVRVLVAQSREPLDRTLRTITFSIGGVGVALVLASIGATRWAVSRGTRPLTDLSARVAALGPDTLDQRLSLDRLPEELAPVAGRLNDLLARLGEAFARERRFTSAASHELRTPIAELRILLEVSLSQPRPPEQWEQTARDGLAVLERAQRLSESLLRLSRAGAGANSAPDGAPADLAVILREQVARAVERSGHDAAQVRIDAPPSLVAFTDGAVAASIINNLVDNALRHGAVTAEHPVCCRASREDSDACVSVANHAPTLSESDVQRLFEPFWQKSAARPERAGFGLGLAVSRALAESAEGSLDAIFDSDRLEVILRVPLPR